MYIEDQEALEAFVERARRSSVLAIDTEFLREKTYYARLCLIQFATDDEVAVVDPFCMEDLHVLAPLLEDAGVMKIFRNQFVKQRRSSQIEQVIPIILILRRQSFQPLVQPGISKSIGRVHRLIVDSGKKIIQ